MQEYMNGEQKQDSSRAHPPRIARDLWYSSLGTLVWHAVIYNIDIDPEAADRYTKLNSAKRGASKATPADMLRYESPSVEELKRMVTCLHLFRNDVRQTDACVDMPGRYAACASSCSHGWYVVAWLFAL